MIATVVIATLNRKDKLARTLDALRSQTYPADRFEVIVVDNGSRDGTLSQLEGLGREWPRLTYAVQPKRGPAAARNMGAERARGEIVVFTDDDCVPPNDWLERIVDGYKSYPHVAGVGGYQIAAEEVLKSNVFAQYEEYISRSLWGVGGQEVVGGFECPAGGTNNMSYRRSVIEEVGGFDESFPVAAGEDADLKKRICDKGYALLFIPVGVIHLQPYTWRSFIRQACTRGIGAAHYHRKHGPPLGLRGPLLYLGVLSGVFFAELVSARRKDFAFLRLIEGVCGCYGQIQYLRQMERG